MVDNDNVNDDNDTDESTELDFDDDGPTESEVPQMPAGGKITVLNEAGVEVEITTNQLKRFISNEENKGANALRNKARTAAWKQLETRHGPEFKAIFETACTQLGVEPYSSRQRVTATLDLSNA